MSYTKEELDEMIDDKSNYFLHLFYFNKKDPGFILPKRVRFFGWQLNYANKWAFFVLLILIAASTIITIYFDK